MASTLCGMLLLGFAPNYAVVLMAAAMVGIGSAIFHPEASRIARLASGGRHGFAQSVFQVGGNFVPRRPADCSGGDRAVWPACPSWFAGRPDRHRAADLCRPLARCTWAPASGQRTSTVPRHPPRTVAKVLAILLVLIFSKYFYMASIGSYFTFT